MKEIRFHGRGGQGVVKAAHILIASVVDEGKYAHFIPFFGVERKGSPVYGFARISDKQIRFKSQVYNPHCLVIMDDSLLNVIPVFEGLSEDGIVVINTRKTPEELKLPHSVKKLVAVDATNISMGITGKEIPNSAVLGAFVRATNWVDLSLILARIDKSFGEKNMKAAMDAYNKAKIYEFEGGIKHD